MNNSNRLIFISKRLIMTGEDVRSTLARNIYYLRTQKGYSQALLAEKADISLPFISSIEQSIKWPYPDTLAKIASALEVEVSYLFSTEESENQNRAFSITLIKNLVEYQKKALNEFGETYLT